MLPLAFLVLAMLSGCERSDCCAQGDAKLVAKIPLRATEPAKETPLQVGGEVLAPQLIKKVEPGLPDHEKRAVRKQPFMFFEIVVDGTGSVTSVRTLKSNDDVLLPYVVAAIKQWKFRPATLRGKPVTVLYNIRFSYEVR
ncbi:MAG: energy transducer TonB [Acidobacteriota bacterium]|nr:energy transducer TonB [Acidobacteriota bacterium]